MFWSSQTSSWAKDLSPLREEWSQKTDQEIEQQAAVLLQKPQKTSGTVADMKLATTLYLLVLERMYRVTIPQEELEAIEGVSPGRLHQIEDSPQKEWLLGLMAYQELLKDGSVILVQARQELVAERAQRMAPLLEKLGVSVETTLYDDPFQTSMQERKERYQADVLYTTREELARDWLLHHLAHSKEQQFLEASATVLVDDADQVLLQGVEVALRLTGNPRGSSPYARAARQFVLGLVEGQEFRLDRQKKTVYLTEVGAAFAQRYFEIHDLYRPSHLSLLRQLYLALQAQYLYDKQEEYIISAGRIRPVDPYTGQLLRDDYLDSDLRQALEIKEGVAISRGAQTISSITYPSLFASFEKVIAVSPLASQVAPEIEALYGLKGPKGSVSSRKMGKRFKDQLYRTHQEKQLALVTLVARLHAKGQPVLVLVPDLDTGEWYARQFWEEDLPHRFLSGQDHASDQRVLKDAGQIGAITIARLEDLLGQTIPAGPGSSSRDGLAVIASDHFSDPSLDMRVSLLVKGHEAGGWSLFFASLDDDWLVQEDRLQAQHLVEADPRYGKVLNGPRYRLWLDRALQHRDQMVRQKRLAMASMDRLFQEERAAFYDLRDRLLNGEVSMETSLSALVARVTGRFLQAHPQFTLQEWRTFMMRHITYHIDSFPLDVLSAKPQELLQFVQSLAQEEWSRKVAAFPSKKLAQSWLNQKALEAVDQVWRDEVDRMREWTDRALEAKQERLIGLPSLKEEFEQSQQGFTQRLEEAILAAVLLSQEMNESTEGE